MTKQSPQVPEAGSARIARNAPCPCGSGEKYKRCCGAHTGSAVRSNISAASPTPASTAQAAQMHFRHGLRLLQSGDTQAAMPSLLEAMQLDRNHFDAHLALGWALLRNGRF